MKPIVTVAAVAAAGVISSSALASDYSWKPDRPINIIVPWSAGGSTDQVTRVVAPILEEVKTFIENEIMPVEEEFFSLIGADGERWSWTARRVIRASRMEAII